MHFEKFTTYKQMLKTILVDFHAKNPLKMGISKEELRTRLPSADPLMFQAALEEAVKEGEVDAEKDRVRLKNLSRKTDASMEKLEGEIVGTLDKSGLTPPTVSEMAGTLGVHESSLRDILEKLVYEGKVVKVKGDLFFSSRHVEDLKRTVREQLTARKEMLPADFKAVTGLSRKYMIPLLEYLDEIKLTIRMGDKRVLRSS
jgi:selenocysteine-specific elongation factor